MLHNENLYTMIGRVQDIRPAYGEERYRTAINDAIRQVINKRNYWSDLRKSGIIAVPDQVKDGTISTVSGQDVVIGTATNWPILDVVNTTLATPVDGAGFDRVALASTIGVTQDSVLLFDAGTPSQEAVAVQRITGATIVARFKFSHAIGCTVTQSSLVGRQFRTGYNYPIFSVTGVVDGQTLLIDNPWGGPNLTNVAYYILKMYFTIDPQLRQLITVVDQRQGIPLMTNKTQQELNWGDPQRTDNSDPQWFVSLSPNASGSMLYEIWPAPVSARQIAYLATLQWPALEDPEDVPPPFLEPTLFTDMAAARALNTRLSAKDDFFDPKLARIFELAAQEKLDFAIASDETRAVEDYQLQLRSLLMPNGGADFWRQHDPFVMNWVF